MKQLKLTETAFDTYKEKAYYDKQKVKRSKEPKKKTTIRVKGIRAIFFSSKSKEKAKEHYMKLYPQHEIEIL